MTPESKLVLYVTVGISFGILHFFLWFFSPKTRDNLFFSIYAFIFSLVVFLDFRSSIAPAHSIQAVNIFIHLQRLFLPFLLISLLLLVYSTFNKAIPKWFWIYCAGIILTGFWIAFRPHTRYNYFYIWILATYLEMGRVLTDAIKKKQSGIWIIVVGFLLFVVFSFYDLATDLYLIPYLGNIHNGYPIGFVGLTGCFSVYLARDFSIQNKRRLEEEKKAHDLELQKKILEEEDKRKSLELNQARDLQLSMLPDASNKPKNLDIAFRMIAATEVGGDYYDFRQADQGLIIAIGDALGHGMRAGMIVTIVKSLFLAETDLRDFTVFFQKCSKVFHTMKLKKLFMGLQLVRIEHDRLTLASAGMPPILIYHHSTGNVETIIQKAMPLGGPAFFPYKQTETSLQRNDVVVMMSDGITERFNQDKMMLGQEPLKEWLKESAGQTAETILNTLLIKTNDWAKTEQRDDITLIILKII